MSVGQWTNRTKAFGLIVKAGRYGGTFAHKDIAFHYAMWLSPEFQIYLINEFQRLKEEEQKQLGWSAKRELTKINYRIHTDAIKQHLIPKELTTAETSVIYANEADVLNVALFGMTAKQWREANQSLKGNIRDYADNLSLINISRLRLISTSSLVWQTWRISIRFLSMTTCHNKSDSFDSTKSPFSRCRYCAKLKIEGFWSDFNITFGFCNGRLGLNDKIRRSWTRSITEF